MARSLPAAKSPITTAPAAQAALYQPAAIPIEKALSATPTVEAAPTAKPVMLTAIKALPSLRPAKRYAVEPLEALFFTQKLMPKSIAMYRHTIIN